MGDGEASGPPLEGGVAFENAAETTELGGVIKEETVGEMLGAESMPRYAMIACNAMSNSETERSDGIGPFWACWMLLMSMSVWMVRTWTICGEFK